MMEEKVTTRIVGVIPAHLASVRFPGKILFPFHDLPMIEHVRRRALLCQALVDVYVATCDQEIADRVGSLGGQVIMTSDQHLNGTSRVAEAINSIDCTHVMLLQGDEPLLLPRHLDAFAHAIISDPQWDAWNATGPMEEEGELDRHSFVKCAVSQTDRILYCFRRSPCYSSFDNQLSFIRKILGIIAFEKNFLLKLASQPASLIERAESIEQMRIIENGYVLRSVPVSHSLPSVNEPDEAKIVFDHLQSNPEQSQLLAQILSA
jgi:3-deoxy-manno-octulosonate cytidylyltransferase (CMP-KDO synthetase)